MGRTAYDFDDYANKDMRKYMKSFALPKPPLDVDTPFSRLKAAVLHGKSHENEALSVRHEERRVLEKINQFKMGDLDVKKWLDVNIPAKPHFPTDRDSDGRYNLPTVLTDLWINKPSQIEGMSPWLCLPLVTTTRVVHSTYRTPAIRSSAFTRLNISPSDPTYDEHDMSRFRYFAWTSNAEAKPDDSRASVIVAYQTPYILSYTDMLEFVSCNSFPAFDERTKDKLPAKYRLWGKVWDTCRTWKSNYFVLTNYTHWVFGLLSEGGREAFVSDIFRYDSASLTILELLVYWTVSSLEVGDTFNRPRVYEPVTSEDINMEDDSESEAPRVPRAPRSESAWPGQSDGQRIPIAHYVHNIDVDFTTKEPGQSAVDELDTLLSGEETPGDRRKIKAQVRTWLDSCRQAGHRRLDEDDLNVPQMLTFEVELLEYTPNQALGEWMVVV